MGLREQLHWFVPSGWAVVPDETWVRKQLKKRGGSFICRIPPTGTSWDPMQSRYNPIAGPAEVTYTQEPGGKVTASVVRPQWFK